MFLLNKENPEIYTLDYFSETLDLHKSILKNVFYNISFPIISGEEGLVDEISFIEI